MSIPIPQFCNHAAEIPAYDLPIYYQAYKCCRGNEWLNCQEIRIHDDYWQPGLLHYDNTHFQNYIINICEGFVVGSAS